MQDIGIRFATYALSVFEEIQKILKAQPKHKVLMQVVVPAAGERQLFAGISGLLNTAGLENPKLVGQLIEVEPGEDGPGIIEKLKENGEQPDARLVCYQNGRRYVTGWRQIEAAANDIAEIPWRNGGSYLITGGMGALGLIFAGEILQRVQKANLILTGRSSINEEIEAKLKTMGGIENKVFYRQVDVADKKAVAGLFQSIKEQYGGLSGIIHCAGIIHDNFIIKKTREEMEAVLAPKVAGLVNLDEASNDLNLDFFILFSSLAVSGNAGQADYSAANAFMDNYARYRNSLVAMNQRQGKTLSINWPLWEDGRMSMGKEMEAIMRRNTGLIPISATAGIRMLNRCLVSGKDQVMVMEGELSKLCATLTETSAKHPMYSNKELLPTADPEQLKLQTLRHLKTLFGDVSKLNVERIDAAEPLESYGIDSVMIMQLNQSLTIIFGEISKTLFYEYRTLEALATYLITDYPQECSEWVGYTSGTYSTETSTDLAWSSKSMIAASTCANSSKNPSKNRTATAAVDMMREPIAIIGLSMRYPKAANLMEFWENLQTGKDCISEILEERWPLENFFLSDRHEAIEQGKSYSKWGGFIDGFAEFDPQFFNISPRDAMNMDPQERLFMECCWEAMEDAGYTKEEIAAKYHGRVGVFAGITKTGFDLYGPDLWRNDERIFPVTSFSSVANRVSYFLNLKGPSMPVDTMCSSSLTAIHEACEHIIHGACEMAITGGVNLYVHPANYIRLCSYQMLSDDGRCKSFGRGADGFAPGEGAGVILLKRLSQALTDRDHIYAVIRGSSINHGGKTNGYTVPNPTAQGELIRSALEQAQINARTVSYIEAHGTGTELGDPIEITGLTQAFRQDTTDKQFCAIGSVKSNIGHLEAAAGIAAVTKVILQMKHRQIAPSLHADELNPNIDFDKTPFVVNRTLTTWERPVVDIGGETREYPRIAGISSFGAGGSNAHVVLEEYIPQETDQPSNAPEMSNPVIIVLSAKNEAQLNGQVRRLLDVVDKRQFSNHDLADAAFTLQVGREAMEERLAVIVSDLAELEDKLKRFLEGQNGIAGLYRGRVKSDKETMAAITTDEELKEAVEKWVKRKKYAKLLDFWTKGLAFDWHKLYGDNEPRRISLPTYSFSKERYWFPQNHTKSGGGANLAAGTSTTSRTGGVVKLPQNEAALSWDSGSLMKPSGIALESLPEGQFSVKESVGPGWPTIKFLETMLVQTENQAATMSDKQAVISADSLIEELAASFAEALYLKRSEVDIDKTFVDMGMDSVIGVEWVRSINKKYGTAIVATKLYDHPNIRQFAGFLEDELQKNKAWLNQTALKPNLSFSIKAAGQTSLSQTENQSTAMLDTRPVISVDSLIEELAVGFAEALYLKRSEVDIDKTFIDMGMDSVIGVEWVRSINKKYGTAIAATKLYDYPNIRQFAGFLGDELQKNKARLDQTALKSNPARLLDEILLKVQQGALDVKQADQILDQIGGEHK